MLYTKADLIDELTLNELYATPFASGTGACSKCGTRFETEGDFAAHYYIPDARYLNLGNCPSDSQVLSTTNICNTARGLEQGCDRIRTQIRRLVAEDDFQVDDLRALCDMLDKTSAKLDRALMGF